MLSLDAAVDTLLQTIDEVVGMAVRRTQTFESARCAVLYPALAEAAHRVGAAAVGLVDVGCSPGLDLQVDRVGLTYGNGQVLGDPSSPVQLSAAIRGDRRLPTRAIPDVVARIGIGRDPLDVTDADDVRRLRACLTRGQPERAAELDAELALAATAPPLLLRGDPVELLAEAVARVPGDALPVVTTTWALSQLPLEQRLRFLHRLDDAAAGRPVAWVSAEGVGVAPAVPTLGDRRASGHSIIGLALVEQSTLRTEAVGRCWSRGRLLSWLAPAGSPAP
ncbi:DUF2332 domain-containing protein [Modestobacter sp. VKM Ac-2977]|uniref:DUF2332 domain-containing protein n=1 Tax=Modestobacter sp. VKM Ac-2977 TaxID=3004131 RepID=UPI0022AAD34B|nr:DUF2332 domain-containing protein [Modestobacter sp. VKM Ac-2977]MCZ2820717.1 DUF2332 domain-containing protein [Modestobacter sp. VKM Ac-2977]